MQSWMVVLIAVASVLAFLAVAFFIGSYITLKIILGRHDKPYPGEMPEKYGVDISWFDAVKDITGELSISSFDGVTLRALHLKKNAEEPSRKVALLMHGYRATPRSMQPYAAILLEKGYDLVIPGQRAHSISDGKYCGMAWFERFDVLRWMDKIIELYGDDVSIALMGVSMGGATAVAVSGMNPPPQLKCIIDDCGFSSQRDEYFACVSKVHLPKPLVVLPLAVSVKLWLGYSIYDADIVPLAAKSTTPTLFIHGKNDTFVPAALGQKLYEACGAEDKSIELFDAIHAGSFVSDRERYSKLLTEFVDKYIG